MIIAKLIKHKFLCRITQNNKLPYIRVKALILKVNESVNNFITKEYINWAQLFALQTALLDGCQVAEGNANIPCNFLASAFLDFIFWARLSISCAVWTSLKPLLVATTRSKQFKIICQINIWLERNYEKNHTKTAGKSSDNINNI